MDAYGLSIIMVLVFLMVTFIMSAYEKIADWDSSKTYYQKAYKGTLPANLVMLLLIFILIAEVFITTLLGFGIYDMIDHDDLKYINYGLVASQALFIILLIGLRLIKDYNGASRVAVYFMITLFATMM